MQCYSTPGLLRWSLWWALATCGYNQILNYVQVLWEHTEPSSNFTVYNGGVEAASSLFGEPLSVIFNIIIIIIIIYVFFMYTKMTYATL